MSQDLPEITVLPDTYEMSPEPVILVATLHGALALCLHDEGRCIGGLLHLRYTNGSGRPADITDNALSSVLMVLDRFKKAVLGASFRSDEVQARVIAHSLPLVGVSEPTATIVDLVKADFADSKIQCGSQLMRRSDGLRVCFEPFHGRMWVCGPGDRRLARTPDGRCAAARR